RHAVDDDPQEDIPGVAVAPTVSGRELEGLLRGERHELVFRVVAAGVERAVGIIGDTGGVGEKMPDGDAPPRRRAVREESRYGVVEGETPLLGEHDDCRSRELFPDRPGLVYGTVGRGHVMLHVGVPVATGQYHAVAVEHGDRNAGDAVA